MKINRVKSENGFTLIDLIVTLAILGILATAMAMRFVDLSNAADGAACKSNQMALEAAQQVHFIRTQLQSNNGRYAASLDDLTPYLKTETIPECPSGGQYHILAQGKISCTFGAHQR